MSSNHPQPALSHSVLDRNALAREDETLIARLREDPATRVIVIHADKTLVTANAALALRSPFAVDAEGQWGYLGSDNGLQFLVCSLPAPAGVDETGGTWQSLRAVGGDLSPRDAELFTCAVSLSRWYVDSPFCSRCGGAATLVKAGWARVCQDCGREHFPRTDPAVIVAVVDDERILLGSNALWENNRFSCFAGFVEAGESLEAAVHREVAEEAAVDVHSLRYFASQPWPYPRSLMLGYFAEVDPNTVAEADGEEILEVRWFTRDEIRAALQGDADIILPGRASIAHALISQWADS